MPPSVPPALRRFPLFFRLSSVKKETLCGIFTTLMFAFKATRKLKQLEEDFEQLTHRFKMLEMEWIDTYDKVRKAMGRVVKDRAIIEQHETSSKPELPEPALVNPDDHRGFLTERQKIIQQQILRRRAGLGGG